MRGCCRSTLNWPAPHRGWAGGALVIGGGAALSALAVTLLPLGSGEMPLVLLMLGCALASAFAILPLKSSGQDLRDPGSLANTDQQE